MDNTSTQENIIEELSLILEEFTDKNNNVNLIQLLNGLKSIKFDLINNSLYKYIEVICSNNKSSLSKNNFIDHLKKLYIDNIHNTEELEKYLDNKQKISSSDIKNFLMNDLNLHLEDYIIDNLLKEFNNNEITKEDFIFVLLSSKYKLVEQNINQLKNIKLD